MEPSAKTTSQKHDKLVKDKDGVDEVEVAQLVKKVKNKIDSPFIN